MKDVTFNEFGPPKTDIVFAPNDDVKSQYKIELILTNIALLKLSQYINYRNVMNSPSEMNSSAGDIFIKRIIAKARSNTPSAPLQLTSCDLGETYGSY